jgi:diadenosine tetraphosphate (Ap4A) HIT family hydrolase
MVDHQKNCLFCNKFGAPSNSNENWYDKILTHQGGFKVIPGLGPLAEGYLLVISTQHYLNIASLPQKKLAELGNLKQHVRDILTQCYEPPIFFEHGPASIARGGGSCIDHAHLHALPIKFDLLSFLRQDHDLMPIDSLSCLAQLWACRPYLFIEDQKGQMYMCITDRIPGQYLRRIIAKGIGISDEWDYALFPKYDVVAATINRLTPWPS